MRQRPRVFVVECSRVAGRGVVGDVVQPAVPFGWDGGRVLSPVAVELSVDYPAVPAVLLLRGHALEVAVSRGVGADESGPGAVDERGLAVFCGWTKGVEVLRGGEQENDCSFELSFNLDFPPANSSAFRASSRLFIKFKAKSTPRTCPCRVRTRTSWRGSNSKKRFRNGDLSTAAAKTKKPSLSLSFNKLTPSSRRKTP